VDGERGIEIVDHIPASSEGIGLEIRGKVLGVYDNGGATIPEQERQLVDVNTGNLYANMTSTSFGVGQGG
jgi:peroxisomal enoyl-CoA hydratase 2